MQFLPERGFLHETEDLCQHEQPMSCKRRQSQPGIIKPGQEQRMMKRAVEHWGRPRGKI